jgi:hypothetical protein
VTLCNGEMSTQNILTYETNIQWPASYARRDTSIAKNTECPWFCNYHKKGRSW